MRNFIALDIGGTNIKYGIISEDGTLIAQSQCRTLAMDGIDSLIVRIENIVRTLLDMGHPISGIGISTAGGVDVTTGEIIYAGPNIPYYKGTNLKNHFEKMFKVPVAVENDVNAAALGEAWMGAGRSIETFFCMTIGTGIGGAMIIHRELLRGHHFLCGEIGYMGKQHEGDQTYEQKAATSALIKRAQQELGVSLIDGRAIFDWAKSGDIQFVNLVREWVVEVAKGMANIICVLDPGVIIVGGAVSEQGNYLMDQIKESLRSLLPQLFVDSIELKPAECGNAAGMYGAVYPFVK